LNDPAKLSFAQKAAPACEEFILFMQKAFPMAMRIGM
jgi:hypothetical protein